MERAVEIFVAINCVVIGFSHLFHAAVWVDFFRLLGGFGRPGAFANGFISLTFGTIIISFHWVWEGVVPSIVTGFGIAQVIKGFIAFSYPEVVLRSMTSAKARKGISYQIGGIVFLSGGIGLLYFLLTGN